MTKTYLFSYGSNSIKQLQERLNLLSPLEHKNGYINDYCRIFSGTSKRWDGGIASIVEVSGKKVYGIVIEITMDQLMILNKFEKGYNCEILPVVINDNIVNCYVYIKKRHAFIEMPSISYLRAINDMLNDRGVSYERKIMIRKYKKGKIYSIGYFYQDEIIIYQ
jgi:hypothetical protein